MWITFINADRIIGLNNPTMDIIDSVEMPCVPPVGSQVFIKKDGFNTTYKVKKHRYCLSFDHRMIPEGDKMVEYPPAPPQVFVVLTERLDIDEDN